MGFPPKPPNPWIGFGVGFEALDVGGVNGVKP